MIHTEKNSAAGSYFDDFLQEQGIFDAVDAVATKRVIAWQVAEEKNVPTHLQYDSNVVILQQTDGAVFLQGMDCHSLLSQASQ